MFILSYANRLLNVALNFEWTDTRGVLNFSSNALPCKYFFIFKFKTQSVKCSYALSLGGYVTKLSESESITTIM